MIHRMSCCLFPCLTVFSISLFGAPTIDPIPNANIPAGKSLTLPITAASSNGRPLTYTIASSTNRITVEVHTNNAFWKMSVVQLAASNSPGAFQTPFRGGIATVTNLGDLTLMLFRDRAPHAVDVFTGLTSSGFYSSNTIFHRVIPGFMIQGGCPVTNGTGGPVFRYEDEFHPRAIFSGSGQLALANSGKDTDGSQFFITLGPQRSLDFGYTLFGQLLRGFNVVSNIINTPRNASDRPLADVIITRASLVPNPTDTVITLTGTNLAGVSGTIQVIADDGAGGRATNTFNASTIADAVNDPPFLITPAVTNLIVPTNGRLTNSLSGLDLESNAMYYGFQILDLNTYLNSTMASFNGTNGLFVIVPNAGYSGPLNFSFAVSPNTNYSPYDSQSYTFVVGDTAVLAMATNFMAQAVAPFTNQLLASFTNGLPNSPSGNFTASINWGDNSITSGSVTTNLLARKEVRGSHSYTNSGDYPVYITIQSALGASATVVATATVLPSLSLKRTGTNNLIKWPAWAADFQLQSQTNLVATNWISLTNPAVLVGYENVISNASANSNLFFRLKR